MNRALDLGPSLRLRRGELAVELRADPEHPQQVLRGARVRDTLREMYLRDRITEAHWQAAERYRDDAALAAGSGLGTLRLAPRVGGGGGGGTGWMPGDAMLGARTRVRQVSVLLGADLDRVIGLVVLHGTSLAATALAVHCGKARAAEKLRDGLEVLAAFYGKR